VLFVEFVVVDWKLAELYKLLALVAILLLAELSDLLLVEHYFML
jgi:hypothetical protein